MFCKICDTQKPDAEPLKGVRRRTQMKLWDHENGEEESKRDSPSIDTSPNTIV